MKQSIKKQKSIIQKVTVEKLSNQNRKDIIFGVVLSMIGLISAPIFLEFGFNKKIDPNIYKNPLLKFFAILSGYLLLIVLSTIFLRIKTQQSTPQAKKDPAQLLSINEMIQNIIIYGMSFSGLYVYMSKNYDIQTNFYYNRLPFVFLATLLIQLTGRLIQIITSFKGFRYIGHMLTFSVFALMILQIL